MSSAELPEGLGELDVWGHFRHGLDPDGKLRDDLEPDSHAYVRAADLLAWAKPLAERLEAAEGLMSAAFLTMTFIDNGWENVNTDKWNDCHEALYNALHAARAAGLGQGAQDV